MRRLTFLFLGILFASWPASSFGLFDGRETVSLGGQWNYIVDPMDTGIYETEFFSRKKGPAILGSPGLFCVKRTD